MTGDFNAAEGFNGPRVRALLFIYLFIYSYFFPASLFAATRRVKSCVQLSALYKRNYDTSKRTLSRVKVFAPPGYSIRALLLSELSKFIGWPYNCTQRTGHACIILYE